MSAPIAVEHRETIDDAVALLHAMVQRRRERQQSQGVRSESLPTKKAAPLPGHGPSDSPQVDHQGEVSR